MGLGQHLVRELGLENGVDTLGRWLSHHVAELIVGSQKATTPAAHREASKQATDVVLKIWKHRAVIPGDANPLARYTELLKVLRLLLPNRNPWDLQSRIPLRRLAAIVYDRLCRLTIGLLVIEGTPRRKAESRGTQAVLDSLTKKEQVLLRELDRWLDAIGATAARRPQTKAKRQSQAIDARKSLEKLVEDAIEQLHRLGEELSNRGSAPEVQGG